MFCLEVVIYKRLQKCDVIMTSSAAMNIQFLHCQNLLFLRYIHCNFCLNLHITHGDMKENVSGCFFSEHSVHSQYSSTHETTQLLTCNFCVSTFKCVIVHLRKSLEASFLARVTGASDLQETFRCVIGFSSHW